MLILPLRNSSSPVVMSFPSNGSDNWVMESEMVTISIRASVLVMIETSPHLRKRPSFINTIVMSCNGDKDK